MADATRVFLSYSHDSDEHAARVLALADALCDGGIEVILDRYVHPAPVEGWPHWMERNLDAAQFVLMVCTETYRRRVMGEEEPGQGTGVRWEGKLIYNRIAYGEPGGIRFIPILLPGAEPTHIPDPVRGHNHYRLAIFDLTDPVYEALYRHLTGQPATPRPGLGPIQILPPRLRPHAVPGPLPPSGGPCEIETSFCNRCLDKTRHRIIWSHSLPPEKEPVFDGIEHIYNVSQEIAYQVLECQGCNNVTFRRRKWFSEWQDVDGPNYEYTYYPPLVSRRKPDWYNELPEKLRSVLDELYIALHADIRYLSAVAARTCLDMSICEKIGDIGTFKDKINKLETDDYITAAERELVEAVTEAGNASAHRGYKPDKKDLDSVIAILESLLHKFYIAENSQKSLLAQASALMAKVPPRKSK